MRLFPSPNFRLAQAIFEPNTFTYKHPNISLLTPHMKMEQTDCSDTSVYNIQTPGYRPKERIQHDYLIYVNSCLLQQLTHKDNFIE
jgi:hypothetical protein